MIKPSPENMIILIDWNDDREAERYRWFCFTCKNAGKACHRGPFHVDRETAMSYANAHYIQNHKDSELDKLKRQLGEVTDRLACRDSELRAVQRERNELEALAATNEKKLYEAAEKNANLRTTVNELTQKNAALKKAMRRVAYIATNGTTEVKD